MEFLNSLYKDNSYREAIQYIQTARRTGSTHLDISGSKLVELPVSIAELTQLNSLNLSVNQLTTLPEQLGKLINLNSLNIGVNKFTTLPASIKQLTNLTELSIENNPLTILPEWLSQLRHLKFLDLSALHLEQAPHWLEQLKDLKELILNDNQLADIPIFLSKLDHLEIIRLDKNPLNPELSAAHHQGVQAVRAYIRAKADSVTLNEAKLIIIGEGEVGKSCLLGALRGDPWEDGRPTTHGIEIKPIKVMNSDTNINRTYAKLSD